MSFFKKPLPSPVNYNHSLLNWWLAVRNYYNPWPVQKSHYTRELEKHMLPMLIDYEKKSLKNKLKIRNLAISWINIHNKHNLNTHRMMQMHQLISHLDKDIKKIDGNIGRFNSFKDLHWPRYEKGLFAVNYYKSVYRWWKSISRLSWYQFRSAQTRKLDNELEKAFTLIIIDDVRLLEDLLVHVDNWIDKRAEKSERLPAVNLLKLQLQSMLEEAIVEDKLSHRYMRTHSLVSTKLCTIVGYLLSDIVFDFQLFGELLML
jgi:hypothetical protein